MSCFQTSKVILMASAMLGFAASPSLALTFNPSTDFSITNNPNGVWQYGWSSSLGSAFNSYTATNQVCDGKLDRWFYPNGVFGLPAVHYNNSGSTFNCGTGTHPSNELTLHPGYSGEYSIVRWSAPEAGTYTLSTKFAGADFVGPTTTDVHVLLNGISLFNDLVNGFGDPSAKSFATTLSVNAGEIIDFAVGYSSGGFWYDTTSLAATISSETPTPPKSVPEPTSALSLLAFGAVGAGFLLKRKQQQQAH